MLKPFDHSNPRRIRDFAKHQISQQATMYGDAQLIIHD